MDRTEKQMTNEEALERLSGDFICGYCKKFVPFAERGRKGLIKMHIQCLTPHLDKLFADHENLYGLISEIYF